MTAPQVWLLPAGTVAIRTGADSFRVMGVEYVDDTEIYGELPADAVRLVRDTTRVVVDGPYRQLATERDQPRDQRDAVIGVIADLEEGSAELESYVNKAHASEVREIFERITVNGEVVRSLRAALGVTDA